MEQLAKLIYKTQSTNLPTTMPAYYYGMPNGKVYVVYARFYEIGFDKTALEFVLAVHKEFTFNYATSELYSLAFGEILPSVLYRMIDKAEPKIKIKKVYRKINSYEEVVEKLNKRALKMYHKLSS
jgi:hypothetical protein